MKEAEHNDQLGISTLGFVYAHIAHMRRFTRPENQTSGAVQPLFCSRFWAGFGGRYLGIGQQQIPGCIASTSSPRREVIANAQVRLSCPKLPRAAGY